ncbi:LLM class F420-dependent oxidoreductase [Nocardia sp. NPDC051570]|uniref:LLM class F420-dependent oxidoreductase n=1 Tax=Nocardia sp. NPDC051570 TaxID=3364324 RepID=UPI0037965882
MRIGIEAFITDESMRPDTLAKAAEERGIASLFVAEHSHVPVSRETPYPLGAELPRVYYRTLDTFVSLAAAAAVTSKILLGTGVALLPQRDVIHTAKEVASLDLLSGGRFLFGVGIGWNREEMRNHGTDPSTRGKLVDEQLTALKALWTQDEAEFDGKYVRFERSFLWPKPVQRPHPPIYLGGNSPAMVARAARHGATWMPIGPFTPEELPTSLARAESAGVPMVPSNLPLDPALLDACAEAGIEHVTLMFGGHLDAPPSEFGAYPKDEVLRRLDELAPFVERYAS